MQILGSTNVDHLNGGGEIINLALKDHVTNASDWQFHQIVTVLHAFCERFIDRFALAIPIPAIQIDATRIQLLGSYRSGRNGFGLRHEITLNSKHINNSPAELLLTFFHELLHAWQEAHGKPGRHNHHNADLRQKALEYGLIVDMKGITTVQAGEFTAFLQELGIDPSPLPKPEDEPAPRPRGQSKLKKWSCGCTNVRCAVELNASCLKCGEMFARAEPIAAEKPPQN
jgi:hypothetical protein